MAEAARSFDEPQAFVVEAPAPNWSGEVHGPVAALHQAIEAGFAGNPLADDAPIGPGPVDALVRIASRITGWVVLAAAFALTATAIF